MNRKEFYATYRQARFLMSARSTYAVQPNVNAPEGTLIWVAINSLHESIVYAMHNKHASNHYPLADNHWAIKLNSTF